MLIFLHGALGTRRQFEPLLTLTAGQAFDFEGHGNRPQLDRPFRLAHFVENLIAYLDEQQIQRADVVGYSMGGYVGLLAALQHPTRVGKVFTLATKFDWTPASAAHETALLTAEALLTKVPQLAASLEQQHPVADWRVVVAKTRDLLLDLGNQPPLTAATLGALQQRVRICVGDRDKMVSIEESLAAYRALPTAEFQVLPHTPHLLERVDMGLLVGAIGEFMAG